MAAAAAEGEYAANDGIQKLIPIVNKLREAFSVMHEVGNAPRRPGSSIALCHLLRLRRGFRFHATAWHIARASRHATSQP